MALNGRKHFLNPVINIEKGNGMKGTSLFTNQRGFTLVELLIATAITGIIGVMIVTAYNSQQHTYRQQDDVAQIQQNIRAAMHLLARDIRLAGYDPTGSANAALIPDGATPDNKLQVTMDLSEDGDIDDSGNGYDEATNNVVEDITYELSGTNLVRNTIVIAEDVEALDFEYLDNDYNDIGNPVANADDIRAVQVSIVARGERVVGTPAYSLTFINQQGKEIWPDGATPDDRYQRRYLTTTVKCRNLGLGS